VLGLEGGGGAAVRSWTFERFTTWRSRSSQAVGGRARHFSPAGGKRISTASSLAVISRCTLPMVLRPKLLRENP
jgi:hypothetical protein